MFKLKWEGEEVTVRFVKRAKWLKPRETRVLLEISSTNSLTGFSGRTIRRTSEAHSDYLAEMYALLDAKRNSGCTRSFWQTVFNGWHTWRKQRKVQGLMPSVRGKEIIHGTE